MENYYLFSWIFLCSFNEMSGECPHGCKCENTTLKCYGIIPNDIPHYIDEVVVHETTFVERFNFTAKGWKYVKSLSLNPDLYAYQNIHDEVYKDLEYFEFEGLDNVEKLQLSCRCLSFISLGAFAGLNKLRVLDLSNNENLLLDSIEYGLMNANLTSLSEVYLSNSSRSVQSDKSRRLQPDFFRIIRRMPLKVFDISSTQAWALDIENYVQEAFPFLEKLNLSDSSRLFLSLTTPVLTAKADANVASFRRLKVYDISYMNVPLDITDNLFASRLAGGKSIAFTVPLELSEGYVKNLLKSPSKLPPVIANLTHLCFLLQPNKSDDKFCLIGKGESMKKIVAAENSVVYLDPDMLNSVPNLQYLDFSSNLMGEMISGGLIQLILDKLLQLETLILSNNGIYIIPRDSPLKSISLRYLDLSFNNLQSLTFDTYNLSSLTTLDLRYNKILVLDTLSMERLLYFLYSNGSSNFDEARDLRLKGNPFSCSCDHIHGLQWLMQHNQGLVCKLESKEHTIDDRLIKQVQYNCKLHFLIAVFSICALIEMISFGVLVYYVKEEYKRQAFQNQIKKGCQKYHERKSKQKYPVFLSFCCEDDEIVMKNIYPHLERGLQKILKTNLPCVATGYNAIRPGYYLAEEIIRCVEASSVVVFFVTNRFCRKSWCRNETLIAHYENKPIILMLWEKVDLKLMPRFLYRHYKNHARVHWVIDEGGQRKMRPGWDELCEVILSRFAEIPCTTVL